MGLRGRWPRVTYSVEQRKVFEFEWLLVDLGKPVHSWHRT